MSSSPNRTVFFVDGFNLYHSISDAEKDTDSRPLKWLDLGSLCESTLHLISPNAVFAGVHYFSAYADHLSEESPEKPKRHRLFVRALTASRRVKFHRGRFSKRKTFIKSLDCYEAIHEEKETDVAIACKVLGMAVQDQLDTAVLITGDSDLLPAVKMFREVCPSKTICFAFPYRRKSKELSKACPGSFSLSLKSYVKNQFPERVRLPSGKHIIMPTEWKK
ncbi:NYN domain-containing protein [Cerasicoccus fimbriatus]|uniref:NYN domain-containing protein n=1 Tax=Cerasicoccus fimbriatus TaxID=3014554 RepID=UPI0022B37C87|nr:NYN domain-containing protein [Cerasicoccus sp. TK19100]